MNQNLTISNNIITSNSVIIGQFYPDLNCILWNTSSYINSETQNISLKYDFSIH
jgi:hypothetical protein